MITHYYLGRVALAQGDLSQAETCIQQATSMCIPKYGIETLGYILLGWAALYTRQGKLPQAARLMGAADKIYQCTKMALALRERVENAEALAAVRAGLGEEAFVEALVLEEVGIASILRGLPATRAIVG